MPRGNSIGHEPLRCLCGGNVYTFEQMIAMAREADDEADPPGWEQMWRGLLGVDELYCSEEDDILGEPYSWRVTGLQTPVHDESHDAEDIF